MALAIPLTGPAVLPGPMATAHADQVTFAPDWPNHRNQTETTICAALAQGWTRRHIVGAAEQANNAMLTADAFIDAARYQDCPRLNAD